LAAVCGGPDAARVVGPTPVALWRLPLSAPVAVPSL